jgi:hypothetical protein
MSRESRILAEVLLMTYPTVIFGVVSLVSMLVFTKEHAANPLRQYLWRAGQRLGTTSVSTTARKSSAVAAPRRATRLAFTIHTVCIPAGP